MDVCFLLEKDFNQLILSFFSSLSFSNLVAFHIISSALNQNDG